MADIALLAGLNQPPAQQQFLQGIMQGYLFTTGAIQQRRENKMQEQAFSQTQELNALKIAAAKLEKQMNERIWEWEQQDRSLNERLNNAKVMSEEARARVEKLTADEFESDTGRRTREAYRELQTAQKEAEYAKAYNNWAIIPVFKLTEELERVGAWNRATNTWNWEKFRNWIQGGSPTGAPGTTQAAPALTPEQSFLQGRTGLSVPRSAQKEMGMELPGTRKFNLQEFAQETARRFGIPAGPSPTVPGQPPAVPTQAPAAPSGPGIIGPPAAQAAPLSARNNNPGNLRFTEFSKAQGATGEQDGFAVFPDPQTGRRALDALLRTPEYQELTIDQAMRRFAPPAENDTLSYTKFIESGLKVPATTPMANLTDADLATMADLITQFESGAQRSTVSRPGDFTSSIIPQSADGMSPLVRGFGAVPLTPDNVARELTGLDPEKLGALGSVFSMLPGVPNAGRGAGGKMEPLTGPQESEWSNKIRSSVRDRLKARMERFPQAQEVFGPSYIEDVADETVSTLVDYGPYAPLQEQRLMYEIASEKTAGLSEKRLLGLDDPEGKRKPAFTFLDYQRKAGETDPRLIGTLEQFAAEDLEEAAFDSGIGTAINWRVQPWWTLDDVVGYLYASNTIAWDEPYQHGEKKHPLWKFFDSYSRTEGPEEIGRAEGARLGAAGAVGDIFRGLGETTREIPYLRTFMPGGMKILGGYADYVEGAAKGYVNLYPKVLTAPFKAGLPLEEKIYQAQQRGLVAPTPGPEVGFIPGGGAGGGPFRATRGAELPEGTPQIGATGGGPWKTTREKTEMTPSQMAALSKLVRTKPADAKIPALVTNQAVKLAVRNIAGPQAASLVGPFEASMSAEQIGDMLVSLKIITRDQRKFVVQEIQRIVRESSTAGATQ